MQRKGVRKGLRKCPIDTMISPSHVRLGECMGKRHLVCEIALQSGVHLGRLRRHVCSEKVKRAWHIIIFLFIHFFLHDDILSDFEALSSALLVDFACLASRLDSSLYASVCSPRSGNISTFLILLMGTFCLHNMLVDACTFNAKTRH